MDILTTIINDTRLLIEKQKSTVPPAFLESLPSFSAPTLSLETTLREGPLSVIAEIKKASPSRGIICKDLDVASVAKTYTANGAQAISVLTEPLHFFGSLEHLSDARQMTDLPLLRKDFIIDPYQLLEARAFGADAVLLIASVLDAIQLRDLHETANELGLDCLVEVYDERELERINFDQVRIIGVNNRNLRTFEVDIAHSVRIFKHVPETLVRVSESGLKSPENLAYLEINGINAVLIGETFMRGVDPGAVLKRTLAETRRLAEVSSRLRLVV